MSTIVIPGVIYFIPDKDRAFAKARSTTHQRAYALGGLAAINLGEWNRNLGAPHTTVVVPVSSEDNLRNRGRDNLITLPLIFGCVFLSFFS